MNSLTTHLKKTPEGLTNLHLWRIGRGYEQQKGKLYRADWNNIYLSPYPTPEWEKDALYYDLRIGVPYADQSFDAVYVLHVLEHLTFHEGVKFLREVNRVLKPGGIIRVSTPDLENIVREYINVLDSALKDPSDLNLKKYHWIKLEIYDQAVREVSGGEMLQAIKDNDYDPDFAWQRYRDVFAEFLPRPSAKMSSGKIPQPLVKLMPKKIASALLGRIKRILKKLAPHKIDTTIAQDPRKTFEANKWLYDQLTLKLVLEKNGFNSFAVKTYQTSEIPGWERYLFDKSAYGDHPIEPSLYAEARKQK